MPGFLDLELVPEFLDLELVQCLDLWPLPKLPNMEQGALGPWEASGVSVE